MATDESLDSKAREKSPPVKYMYPEPEEEKPKPKQKSFLSELYDRLMEWWDKPDKKERELEAAKGQHAAKGQETAKGQESQDQKNEPQQPSEQKSQYRCLNCSKDLHGPCFYCEGDMNYLCWDCVQFNDKGERVCPNCGGELQMTAM